MRQLLHQFRFYLEIIALPVFLFLIVHLSGHALGTFLKVEREDFEILGGLFFLVLFVWLWHRPFLKKWVPCSHIHCHHKPEVPHLLAIIALVLHFFPEAGVRHELLTRAFEGGVVNTIALIGFAAHFLVDVIVAVLISSYWQTRKAQLISFGSIALVWIVAFWLGKHVGNFFPEPAEGVLFLVSAFLLAMFVHMPHKPIVCGRCE